MQIASGHAFNLVLTKEGKVFTWGRNEQGQVSPCWLALLDSCMNGLGLLISRARPRPFFGTPRRPHQLGLGGGISMDVYSMEALPLVIEALQGG